MTNPPRQPQIPLRLSGYYAAIFLIVGVKSPFWPVFLSGRGLGAREIALLFAAAISRAPSPRSASHTGQNGALMPTIRKLAA